MDRIGRMMPFSDASGKLSFRIMFSYVFDYAILIVLALIYGAIDKIVTPFAQRFSLNNIWIQYPYAEKERIPIRDALLISGAFPLVVIALYTLVIDGLFSHSARKGIKKYTLKQRLWELNCGVLGLLLAQGAAFCITGTLKNLVGRPRPDLLSRCLPEAGAADGVPFGLNTKAICTQQDQAIMQDAFRSWPSGHSSSSFAGLGYLSLYLTGKLHVWDQRGEVWRTVIVVIPLVAAACIAASRVMDYRHHPTDVLSGMLLGIACAWGAYLQYFPPLSHVWMKGRAYPMREWGVPSKKQEDYFESAYSTGRANRNTDSMSRHGPAEELPYHRTYSTQGVEEHQMYDLEAPRRQPVRTELPSHDFEHVTGSQSPGDETDYEVVRSRAQMGMPSHGLPQPSAGGANVFREQINRNQSQRRPAEVHSEDEEDIGAGNRSLLVSPNKQ